MTVFSADGEKTVTSTCKQAPPIDGRFVSLGEYRFEKNGQGFVMISNEGTKGHVIADAVQFLPVDGARVAATAPSCGEAKPTRRRRRTLQQLEAELKQLKASGPKRDMAMSVVEEAKIEDTRVHVRGSVHNLGEPAPRGFLQVATAGDAPAMPAATRAAAASWPTGSPASDNPLTARVFVNRAWHWLFGAGLVRTADNFGTTGETPSHPELLDDLAVRFVEDGWSVKKLVRRIVLSRAYRHAVGRRRRRPRRPTRRTACSGGPTAAGSTPSASATRSCPSAASSSAEMGGPTFPADLAADYGYKHDRRPGGASTLPVFRNALPELFEVFDFADPSMVGSAKSNTSNSSGSVAEDRGVDAPPGRSSARSRSPRPGRPGRSGPPSRRWSWPLTARIVSRMHSASSRRRFIRQSRRFSGSAACASAIVGRGEPVGVRQDDPPHQPLDRPAVLHEPDRQVVEQLGVRRGLARGAEVVGRAHQARAEQPVPGAVDDDAGRQRVVVAGEPGGELATAALVARECGRLAGRSPTRRNPRGRLAEVVDAAADVDPRVADLRLLDHRHRQVPLRPARLEPLQLGLQLLERRVRGRLSAFAPAARRRRGDAGSRRVDRQELHRVGDDAPFVPSVETMT